MRQSRLGDLATIAVVAASALGIVAVAGCQGSHPDSITAGTVKGRLVRVGGPAPGAPVPLPGHVTATATGGTPTQTVRVSKDGEFSFNLPVGTYHLTGTSPLIGSGHATCSAMHAVRVQARQAITGVQVICSIR
jgi:hypothetical protein